ncbi:MAG: peptide chain release factor N(5)-glutamine methyltransferase [Acholeplasmataceae bacterium]|jgi:release factor glutamine methyltransferase|nr:peptide chain release factor N(5)-glutamine methyltransferase [Acholeplasmataceae bacterium]
MTYKELLKKGYDEISKNNLEKNAAKLFLMKYSNKTYNEIILNYANEVTKDVEISFLNAINEYINKKTPPQYIINEQDFYGRTFYVDENVLIPRWETEELVFHVIKYIKENFKGKTLKILDIGTGSGCIATTLALELENVKITATDISEKVLSIAQKNSERLCANNIEFVISDLFKNVKDKFDIIISNPPYVKDNEKIGECVDKEPKTALYGGILGVDFYDRILKEVSHYLEDKFLIAFEHGFDQKILIKNLIKKHLKDVKIKEIKDSSDKDRIIFIEGD